jgi:hypothetical protein
MRILSVLFSLEAHPVFSLRVVVVDDNGVTRTIERSKNLDAAPQEVFDILEAVTAAVEDDIEEMLDDDDVSAAARELSARIEELAFFQRDDDRRPRLQGRVVEAEKACGDVAVRCGQRHAQRGKRRVGNLDRLRSALEAGMEVASPFFRTKAAAKAKASSRKKGAVGSGALPLTDEEKAASPAPAADALNTEAKES